MRLSFPRDREARKAVIQSLLMKHHVDIARLWKNLPQVPDPEIGIPFTGPLVPVPFVWQQTDRSGGTVGTTDGCCESVTLTVSGVVLASGVDPGVTESFFNGVHRLPLTVSDGTTCEYSTSIPVGGSSAIISVSRFLLQGRTVVTLSTPSGAASYELHTLSTSPLTLPNVHEYGPNDYPDSVYLVNDCAEGESGSLGCGDCPDSFTFTASSSTFDPPAIVAGCYVLPLAGDWVLTKVPGGYCEWSTAVIADVSGSDGGVRWVMYQSSPTTFTLAGFVYACQSTPIFTMTSTDPCTGTMSFDGSFHVDVTPA